MKFLVFLFSFSAFAFDWQGHRGARGLYPENTIGAMEEALKYPVTTLELDVVLSKDHKVVVSHEPWMGEEICLDLKRKEIKKKKFNLYKMNYEEIQKFDCGSRIHPRFPEQKKISLGKPTLDALLLTTEEILKKLNRADVQYSIEIKSSPENEREGFQPDIKTFSDDVLKSIKNIIPTSRFSIQSFDWRVLKYIHSQYPDVRMVALFEGSFRPENVVKEIGFKPYVFSPYFKFLSKTQVEELHAMGIKVIPWTVNAVEDMEALIKMGVDGIITDYPNKIKQVNQKRCKPRFNLFEGKCVKVPLHAFPSAQNPGWDCKHGYVQKRSRCLKIPVPDNGRLTSDGKNWECLEGFRRYRSSCVK